MLNLLCAKPEAITSRFSDYVINMHAYCVLDATTFSPNTVDPSIVFSFLCVVFFSFVYHRIKFIMKCVCVFAVCATGTQSTARQVRNLTHMRTRTSLAFTMNEWLPGSTQTICHLSWPSSIVGSIWLWRPCQSELCSSLSNMVLMSITETTFAQLIDRNSLFRDSTLCNEKKFLWNRSNWFCFVFFSLSIRNSLARIRWYKLE